MHIYFGRLCTLTFLKNSLVKPRCCVVPWTRSADSHISCHFTFLSPKPLIDHPIDEEQAYVNEDHPQHIELENLGDDATDSDAQRENADNDDGAANSSTYQEWRPSQVLVIKVMHWPTYWGEFTFNLIHLYYSNNTILNWTVQLVLFRCRRSFVWVWYSWFFWLFCGVNFSDVQLYICLSYVCITREHNITELAYMDLQANRFLLRFIENRMLNLSSNKSYVLRHSNFTGVVIQEEYMNLSCLEEIPVSCRIRRYTSQLRCGKNTNTL